MALGWRAAAAWMAEAGKVAARRAVDTEASEEAQAVERAGGAGAESQELAEERGAEAAVAEGKLAVEG